MGAQGTGKTTLVDKFLVDYPHYHRYLNIQRYLKSTFDLSINDEATFTTQFAISTFFAIDLHRHINYIADRTIIDTFVYASSCPTITSEQIQFIINTYSKCIDEYDYIFYTPIEFTPPEDGFRKTDTEYRYLIDSCFQKYLIQYTNIITLTGTVEQRYNTILQTIKGNY